MDMDEKRTTHWGHESCIQSVGRRTSRKKITVETWVKLKNTRIKKRISKSEYGQIVCEGVDWILSGSRQDHVAVFCEHGN